MAVVLKLWCALKLSDVPPAIIVPPVQLSLLRPLRQLVVPVGCRSKSYAKSRYCQAFWHNPARSRGTGGAYQRLMELCAGVTPISRCRELNKEQASSLVDETE
jgi:hypothetical protein